MNFQDVHRATKGVSSPMSIRAHEQRPGVEVCPDDAAQVESTFDPDSSDPVVQALRLAPIDSHRFAKTILDGVALKEKLFVALEKRDSEKARDVCFKLFSLLPVAADSGPNSSDSDKLLARHLRGACETLQAHVSLPGSACLIPLMSDYGKLSVALHTAQEVAGKTGSGILTMHLAREK